MHETGKNPNGFTSGYNNMMLLEHFKHPAKGKLYSSKSEIGREQESHREGWSPGQERESCCESQ